MKHDAKAARCCARSRQSCDVLQADWKIFMSCSKLPDIHNDCSFHDWLVDWSTVIPLTIADVTHQLNDAEALCRDIFVGAVTAEEKQDAAGAEKYQNSLANLQSVMRSKLNATTAWLLLVTLPTSLHHCDVRSTFPHCIIVPSS